MPWSTPFPSPIEFPDGGEIVTLRDGGAYIMKLPKAQHDSTLWQSAMHVLIQAADHDGPIEFARLGMLQALLPKGTPVYHSVDKGRNRTKLARDR